LYAFPFSPVSFKGVRIWGRFFQGVRIDIAFVHLAR
jgi:hypothetical protein